MIIITDNLKKPFDEGAKIATMSLIESINNNNNTYVISLYSNDKLAVVDASFSINKLLINSDFYRVIKKQSSKNILYIPSGSATIFSIIRSILLNIFTNKTVYLYAFQPRQYAWHTRLFLRAIHPELIITPSRKSTQQFNKLNIRSVSLPLGIDDKQYIEFNTVQKRLVRHDYNIAQEKMVLLHVGHIQHSRNLGWRIFIKTIHYELV